MSLSAVTRTTLDGRVAQAIDDGAEHVVGLEARHLEQGQAQRLEQLAHEGIWVRRSSGMGARVSL